MQIHLPSDIEQSIMAAVQAGDYDRVADELAAAVRDRGAKVTVGLDESEQRTQSWKEFEADIDVDKLAVEQGVGPVVDTNDLIFPAWPEDESVDDFIAAAKGRDLPNVSP